MNYLKKYIKYKNKYTYLKNNLYLVNQKGGKLFVKDEDIKYINRFDNNNNYNYHLDIELFLNPIYGLIMFQSGFISNIYFINKDKNKNMKSYLDIDIKVDNYKIINKLYTNIGNIVRHSTIIITNIENISKYIALLYLCKDLFKDDIENNFLKCGDKYNPYIIQLIIIKNELYDLKDNIKYEKSKYEYNENKEKIDSIINNTDIKQIRKLVPLGINDKKLFYILLSFLW
jgi:hypothetical protein